jgi:hypothetical protein
MKKSSLIFFFVLVSYYTKADTIDFWHIYKNKELIAEFNGILRNEFTFKQDQFLLNDTIWIKYFSGCFPFKENQRILQIKTTNNEIVFSSQLFFKERNTFFLAKELINLNKNQTYFLYIISVFENRSTENTLIEFKII